MLYCDFEGVPVADVLSVVQGECYFQWIFTSRPSSGSSVGSMVEYVRAEKGGKW